GLRPRRVRALGWCARRRSAELEGWGATRRALHPARRRRWRGARAFRVVGWGGGCGVLGRPLRVVREGRRCAALGSARAAVRAALGGGRRPWRCGGTRRAEIRTLAARVLRWRRGTRPRLEPAVPRSRRRWRGRAPAERGLAAAALRPRRVHEPRPRRRAPRRVEPRGAHAAPEIPPRA